MKMLRLSSWTKFLVAFCILTSAIASKFMIHDASFAPDTILRVSQVDAALACVYRTSLVVNGTSPGPVLELTENQTTWVRVYNDVVDSNVTIHWHGLSQSVAPFSDGTPRASQWPIPPLHFFDYEIRPNIGEAGSYFYHSHVGFQAVTAAGPMIVREACGKPPYDYDEEHIFMITELYNLTDASIERGLVADPFVFSGETEAILVNGKATHALSANATNVKKPYPAPRAGSPTCGPEIFHVLPNKTYRFRFIAAQALTLITLGIEGHRNLTIIEADGSYTQPHKVHHIQVDSGQRFDVLLHTKSQAQLDASGKTQFYIQMETRSRPVNSTFYAILSYNSDPSTAMPTTPPLTLPTIVGSWLEYALEPLYPNNFPAAAEVTRRVYISNAMHPRGPVVDGNTGFVWLESDHVWLADNYTAASMQGIPYLVSIYEKGEAAIPSLERAKEYGGWDPVFDAYPAELGEVIEIILENEPNGRAGGKES